MKTPLRAPYDKFFGTLANQFRIDIIETLKEGPKNVTEICNALKCNQSTISHNLQRLEKCGFVFVKPQGRERVYELNKETIAPLLDMLHKHMGKYCKKMMG